MFENLMTDKMPCWDCKKYDNIISGECPILKGFLKVISEAGRFPDVTEENISGITFDCKKHNNVNSD